MIEKSKVMVVGASGLVGRELVRALAPANEVVAVARFRNEEVRASLEALGARIVPKDLERETFDDVPPDIDYAFHVVASWGREDKDLYRVNAWSVGDLVERLSGAKGIVVTSTGSVYPHDGDEPETEDGPFLPSVPYSVSKLVGEEMARRAAARLGRPVVVLRYYWPYSPEKGYVTRLAAKLATGEPVMRHAESPGNMSPTYIDDVVRYTLAAAEAARPGEPLTLNCVGPEDFTYEAAVEEMARALEVDVKWTDGGWPRETHYPDRTRLLQALGPAEVTLAEGVRRIAPGLAELAARRHR